MFLCYLARRPQYWLCTPCSGDTTQYNFHPSWNWVKDIRIYEKFWKKCCLTINKHIDHVAPSASMVVASTTLVLSGMCYHHAAFEEQSVAFRCLRVVGINWVPVKVPQYLCSFWVGVHVTHETPPLSLYGGVATTSQGELRGIWKKSISYFSPTLVAKMDGHWKNKF